MQAIPESEDSSADNLQKTLYIRHGSASGEHVSTY